jgi:hypothetical protein
LGDQRHGPKAIFPYEAVLLEDGLVSVVFDGVIGGKDYFAPGYGRSFAFGFERRYPATVFTGGCIAFAAKSRMGGSCCVSVSFSLGAKQTALLYSHSELRELLGNHSTCASRRILHFFCNLL